MPAMGYRRTVAFVCFVLPLFAALSAASAQQAPAAFVQELGDRTIEVLTNESYSDEVRMSHYRALLRDGFAVKTIGRFALGRHWRTATPEMREEYLGLFEEFVLDIYSKRLDGFAGETFTMGDIPAGAILYRYFAMELDHPSLPNLMSWYTRLGERPAYQAHVAIPFPEMWGRLAY